MDYLDEYMKESYASQTELTMHNVLDYCRDLEKNNSGDGVKAFHEIVGDNFKDQKEAVVHMVSAIVDYDRPYEINMKS